VSPKVRQKRTTPDVDDAVVTMTPRQPTECEILAGQMGMTFSKFREQMEAMQLMIADTADKLAACATREDLVALAWELTNEQTEDSTAVAATKCRCLACGRPKSMMARMPGIADTHLIEILNSPPLSKTGQRTPGANVRVLFPDSPRTPSRNSSKSPTKPATARTPR
jgi:hypothetical protein